MPSRTALPPTGSLDFSCELNGPGWMRATISDSARRARLTASYLSDAVGGLVDAVNIVVAGGSHAECVWDEEPGEYRWRFDRSGDAIEIRIEAADFPREENDREEDDDDSASVSVFETRISSESLASAIANGLRSLLDHYGEAKYEAKWEYPFPTEALKRLENRVTDGVG